MGEQRRNKFVFGLLECDSDFGGKCLYLSPSSLYCFPSCLLFGVFWAVDFTWVLEALPRLDWPKISFFFSFQDAHASHLPPSSAPAILCTAPTRLLIRDLVSLLGSCVSLGFH